MAPPNFYLVSYDISDPKRLREMNKTMKGFGRRLHYSVFRCDLSPKGKIEMKAAISEVINHIQDRVMIINLGPAKEQTEKRITFMGRHPQKRNREAIIV